MTRAVIFDVDGTLIDSVDLHAEAWAEALRHFHVDVTTERMRPEIGKGADQLLPIFLPGDKLASERERIAAFRADLFRDRYLSRVKPFPSVPALFERCRAAGLTVVLASSGAADEVRAYSEIAGILDLVDQATSSDDADRSKPQPDIFLAALAKVPGLRADDAVVIGDTPWDMLAATKAGIPAIGVLCGGVDEDTLRKAGAFAIYRDPADLLARFDDSPLAR